MREQGIVDEIILVDDRSRDNTVAVASSLPGVRVHVHERNTGYGGNQKTCYRLALDAGADIVIMLHPDYQYTPKLIPAMASIIANGLHPCVLGSRILGGYSLRGGMPLWKYVANRFLTAAENVLLGAKLSEYHTGYRAFSREILETLDLSKNSDDFVFDNQMLAQILWHGFTIGEVSCPTKYFKEASSINFRRSVKYGFGCLATWAEIPAGEMGAGAIGIVSDKNEVLLTSDKWRVTRTGVPRFPSPVTCHPSLYAGQRDGEARFLAAGGRAGDDVGFDGLVVGGMDAGQRLGRLVLFAGGKQIAVIFFLAAQAGFDAAVVLMLALIAAHAAFG